jgi:hypothetical protein
MDVNPWSVHQFREKYNPKQHGICGRTQLAQASGRQRV